MIDALLIDAIIVALHLLLKNKNKGTIYNLYVGFFCKFNKTSGNNQTQHYFFERIGHL